MSQRNQLKQLIKECLSDIVTSNNRNLNITSNSPFNNSTRPTSIPPPSQQMFPSPPNINRNDCNKDRVKYHYIVDSI